MLSNDNCGIDDWRMNNRNQRVDVISYIPFFPCFFFSFFPFFMYQSFGRNLRIAICARRKYKKHDQRDISGNLQREDHSEKTISRYFFFFFFFFFYFGFLSVNHLLRK